MEMSLHECVLRSKDMQTLPTQTVLLPTLAVGKVGQRIEL